MSKRRAFEQFRKKALKKPGVREEYDALGPPLKRQLIARREAAAFSPEQSVALLGTHPVSRRSSVLAERKK